MISFLLPGKNTDGSPLVETPVARLLLFISEAEESGESRSISMDEFLKKARLDQTFSPEVLEKATVDRIIILEQNIFDAFGDKATGRRFYYAVQLMNRRKKVSPLSEILPIVIVKPSSAPHGLSAHVEEEGIRLSWESPESDSLQGSDRLFNVYRTEISPEDSSPDEEPDRLMKRKMRFLLVPLNESPVTGNSFIDRSSVSGKDYLYSVRELYNATVPYRESEDSNIVKVSAVDSFPPGAPSGLAVVADEKMIRLFWFPNDENDLAGYRIYRKTEEEEEFRMIATLPEQMTSYTDGNVISGMRYSYFVTAFDSAKVPNESAPSENVSESPLLPIESDKREIE
ncbi:MAG: fibronectin type III domain-containing protein [Acidobacteriota bacterium]